MADDVAKLSDIGERGAIEVLARIYDRGQPIGLGHDCGAVEWGDDYLVVTTDVVNSRTHIPPGATRPHIGWDATAVNLSDLAAAGPRPRGARDAATPGLVGGADGGPQPDTPAVSANRRRDVLLRLRRGHELHGPLRRTRVEPRADGGDDTPLVPSRRGLAPEIPRTCVPAARRREGPAPVLRRRLRADRHGPRGRDPDRPRAVRADQAAGAEPAHGDRQGRLLRRERPRHEIRPRTAPEQGLGALPSLRDSVTCNKGF